MSFDEVRAHRVRSLRKTMLKLHETSMRLKNGPTASSRAYAKGVGSELRSILADELTGPAAVHQAQKLMSWLEDNYPDEVSISEETTSE